MVGGTNSAMMKEVTSWLVALLPDQPVRAMV